MPVSGVVWERERGYGHRLIAPYYNVRTKLYCLLQSNFAPTQDVVGDGRKTGKNVATAILIGRGVPVPDNGPQESRRYDLWGWLLFVISTLFSIASSIRNGDIIGLLGGVFFLLACVAFLATYVGGSKG